MARVKPGTAPNPHARFSPPDATVARTGSSGEQAPELARGRARHSLPPHGLALRTNLHLLSTRETTFSQPLPEVNAVAPSRRAEGELAQRLSTLLCDAPHSGGFCGNPHGRCLLRPFRFATLRGSLRRQRARLFQSAPLPDQNSPRSFFPRLHLFRNEDVPGALFRRLHKKRLRCRGAESSAVPRHRRRVPPQFPRARKRKRERAARFRTRRGLA